MSSLPDIDTVLEWKGRTVIDRDGEKVGTFEEIYLDTETDRPEWASVKTGRFGLKQSFVPLSEATEADEQLQVPWERQHIEDAPKVDPDGELSQDDEASLYQHYGLDYSKQPSETGLPQGGGRAGAGGSAGEAASTAAAEQTGDATSAGAAEQTGNAPSAGAAEQPGETASAGAAEQAGDGSSAGGAEPGGEDQDLAVETGPRERVRLRKYVVTEHVTRTVPVEREEVRVEREPISGGDSPEAGD